MQKKIDAFHCSLEFQRNVREKQVQNMFHKSYAPSCRDHLTPGIGCHSVEPRRSGRQKICSDCYFFVLPIRRTAIARPAATCRV